MGVRWSRGASNEFIFEAPVGPEWLSDSLSVSDRCRMGVGWVSDRCRMGVGWVSDGCRMVSDGYRIAVGWVSDIYRGDICGGGSHGIGVGACRGWHRVGCFCLVSGHVGSRFRCRCGR